MAFGALSVLVCAPAWAGPQACIERNNQGADAKGNHRLLAARDAFRACIAEPGCPEIVLSECVKSLDDLKATIPTFVVSIVDEAGHDVESPELTIDGVSSKPGGAVIELDPGSHELVASAQGVTSRLWVEAREHDQNRRLELVLRFERPAPTPPAPLPAPSPPVTASANSSTPVYVLAGVAAAGALGFGYFSLVGHSELNDLDRCKPACNPDDVHRMQSKYYLADLSLGVSLVALAAGGYLLWSHQPSASARSAGLKLDLTPTLGGGLLTFALRK